VIKNEAVVWLAGTVTVAGTDAALGFEEISSTTVSVVLGARRTTVPVEFTKPPRTVPGSMNMLLNPPDAGALTTTVASWNPLGLKLAPLALIRI
jgi:hypothetical protein